jgi:signal transduction histidine kinase
MSAGPTEPQSALRAAELEELLAYLNASWDDERRTLSRQMHDSLGSSLTALTMHLGLLTSKLPPDQALQDRVAQMKKLLHTIIETNRAMQHKLWNDKLEFLGIRAAFSEMAAEYAAAHQLQIHCSLPDDEPVCPRGHAVVVLRALEEGLRNVSRHAQAQRVDVIVDDNDEAIMLTVKDDGVGPPADLSAAVAMAAGALAASQHGLRVVRERAAWLGGTLVLAAAQAHGEGARRGAVLTLVLPKPSAA